MLELQADSLVGKGLHREVYVHPDDENKCVKVVVLRGEKETKREQAYYRFLQNKDIGWNSLPRFYGNIDTNLGSGAVFDLVRDEDGNVSKTFEFYLNHLVDFEHWQPLFIDALKRLKADMLKQNIIAMTIKPKNMVMRYQSGKLDCLIIDNIGNSDILPIASHCAYFGQQKINRKWDRLKALLIKSWPDARTISQQI
jgi:hypothetical protein